MNLKIKVLTKKILKRKCKTRYSLRIFSDNIPYFFNNRPSMCGRIYDHKNKIKKLIKKCSETSFSVFLSQLFLFPLKF